MPVSIYATTPWIALDEEIAMHDRHLVRLTTETAPTLREGFGVGAGTAAHATISKRESRTPSSGISRSSAMVFEPGHPVGERSKRSSRTIG